MCIGAVLGLLYAVHSCSDTHTSTQVEQDYRGGFSEGYDVSDLCHSLGTQSTLHYGQLISQVIILLFA